MEQKLIEFKDVSKRLGNLAVLDHVDLHINKGEIFTLIGKSGVGKSVLLKHIIGLMEPDSGQILYNGKPRKIRRFREPGATDWCLESIRKSWDNIKEGLESCFVGGSLSNSRNVDSKWVG